MRITLELTETEAIYVRDALVDKAIQLRTGPDDLVIQLDTFLSDPKVSERRKQNYQTLIRVRDYFGSRGIR